jgi:predicted hydrocarbon binding protein
MDRKKFINVTSALVALGAGRASGKQETEQPSERWQKMHQAWITSLLESLDANVDDPTRTRLMLSAGRACARRSGILAQAQAANGDLDKLVATMAKHVGQDNCRREGNVVRLRYPKCYCPIVGAGPERLSNTWCHCSRGWVHEVFETVAGKPVKVELTHSIKRGDPDCRFLIHL